MEGRLPGSCPVVRADAGVLGHRELPGKGGLLWALAGESSEKPWEKQNSPGLRESALLHSASPSGAGTTPPGPARSSGFPSSRPAPSLPAERLQGARHTGTCSELSGALPLRAHAALRAPRWQGWGSAGAPAGGAEARARAQEGVGDRGEETWGPCSCALGVVPATSAVDADTGPRPREQGQTPLPAWTGETWAPELEQPSSYKALVFREKRRLRINTALRLIALSYFTFKV